MSGFRLIDWIVPPAVVPLFSGFLALAAAFLHG